MSIFKCKMCGGTIEFNPGDTVGTCEFCGSKQTLPKANDEVITNLFNRANNLRLKCEFDKAEAIYEKIVEQDDSEAEAHWGIVLCKYGIEYVEDPKTFTRIPTCHRTLFESVITDADYQAAIDYSDTLQQSIYEAEARAIDRMEIKEIKDDAWLLTRDAFDIYRQCMYEATFSDYRNEINKTLKDPSCRIFVCSDLCKNNGILVLELSSEGEAQIVGIAVRKNFQRNGVGKNMIFSAARCLKIKRILAETDDDAVGFYRHIGFSVRLFVKFFSDGSVARYCCELTI